MQAHFTTPRALSPSSPSSPPLEPRALHAALDNYAPSPLLESHQLAQRFGVGRVLMKLEADRFGLPSFKVLGASWATVQALEHVLPADWQPSMGLQALAGRLPELTLVAATDGNHGRALAWIARLLGLHSRIYVPSNLSDERCRAIADEGATIVHVDGSYDETVAQSAREAAERGDVLVSDTSWPGYERVPGAVIDGYSTILWELDEQLAGTTPDLVLVPLGVGAFGAAVVRHFRAASPQPRIIGVEPTSAACVMASLIAGEIVEVPGPHDSVMAGLNCGIPSYVAWPTLRDGLDGVVSIDDGPVLDEVRRLAGVGIDVGECSAAGVAAAAALTATREHREQLALDEGATVLLFATEGVTDAQAFEAAVGAGRETA